MSAYLGVDGGGTKTKFLLTNESGKTIAVSYQSTCHYLQCGFDGISAVMRDGLQDCLEISGLKETDIKAAFVACAGYGDIQKDCYPIEEAVRKVFQTFPFQVGNDTENALAGSLGGAVGINIIAGTGSIGSGKDESGRLCRSGGWHHAFGGDEGSAYWIACAMILEFTRQSDGRDRKTALYHYLSEKYNFKDDSDILSKCVVEWEFDRTKIASMAKDIFELAKMKDPYAIQIYKNAAKELADIIISIDQQLNFKNKIPVSYTGGVFLGGAFILEPLREYLPDHMVLQAPIAQPDQGGVILAMQLDHKTITQEILDNLIK